ncbi:MAG TPA: aldo/keto reductase, partial [Vicinamibacterales bacterium]
LEALSARARLRGVEMSALALGWVLHRPGVDSAVIGPRRPEHIAAALAALEISPSETGAALDAVFENT